MNGGKGFTLLELLVVVAIVGILSAIAVYQFSVYQASALCGSIEADVKNTVTAQEAEFVENQVYDPSVVIETQHKGGANDVIAALTLAGDGNVTGTNSVLCPSKGTYTYTQATGKYAW